MSHITHMVHYIRNTLLEDSVKTLRDDTMRNLNVLDCSVTWLDGATGKERTEK